MNQYLAFTLLSIPIWVMLFRTHRILLRVIKVVLAINRRLDVAEYGEEYVNSKEGK